jgi:MFS family permease
MPEENSKENGEVAVPIASGDTVNTYDANEEPRYGWVVCGALSTINGFTWGILAVRYTRLASKDILTCLQSYGVYLSYYINHATFPGTSDLDYTFIGGVNFAAALISAPLVNLCTQKFGTNVPMYWGSIMFSGGFIAASFATEFWHLVLSQGLLVGLGTGFVWQPATPVLPQWFNKNRSLAQGIAAAGSGLVGVIFSAATTPMIDSLSLAWSLRITGIISLGALLVASVLIRDRNTAVRPRIKIFDGHLLKQYRVWLLMGYSFFNILGYIVTIYSLSAFAISIGLTQSQGGIVTTILNLGTAVGRPFVGILSDRFGRMTVVAALTTVNVVFVYAVWIPCDSFGLLIFIALVLGVTSGLYWSVRPTSFICAEIVLTTVPDNCTAVCRSRRLRRPTVNTQSDVVDYFIACFV